jgi:hypothetical protein
MSPLRKVVAMAQGNGNGSNGNGRSSTSLSIIIGVVGLVLGVGGSVVFIGGSLRQLEVNSQRIERLEKEGSPLAQSMKLELDLQARSIDDLRATDKTIISGAALVSTEIPALKAQIAELMLARERTFGVLSSAVQSIAAMQTIIPAVTAIQSDKTLILQRLSILETNIVNLTKSQDELRAMIMRRQSLWTPDYPTSEGR